MRSLRVLGQPEDVAEVVRQLEIHGALIERVVVAEPAAQLSPEALEALLKLERASAIRVEWVVERLGLDRAEPEPIGLVAAEASGAAVSQIVSPTYARHAVFTYGRAKRALDFVGAALLFVLMAPVLVLLAIATAIDVGWPLVFWQWRPGRNGYPFKLYKFRTMRGAHDADGARIPDEARLSRFGAFLRGSRLDELPQLYNVLIGEMSFVGPRPLLPCDQPDEAAPRLHVRPGLTGLAQAYGERTMNPNDKGALDIWYIQNASFWLDTKILLRTAIVFLRGERLDAGMLEVAREAFQPLSDRPTGPLPAE